MKKRYLLFFVIFYINGQKSKEVINWYDPVDEKSGTFYNTYRYDNLGNLILYEGISSGEKKGDGFDDRTVYDYQYTCGESNLKSRATAVSQPMKKVQLPLDPTPRKDLNTPTPEGIIIPIKR